jgi:hypothetical protein
MAFLVAGSWLAFCILRLHSLGSSPWFPTTSVTLACDWGMSLLKVGCFEGYSGLDGENTLPEKSQIPSRH